MIELAKAYKVLDKMYFPNIEHQMRIIKMEDLALVILNYNSYNDCTVCIDQLLSFEEKFHIILVDNSSTDESYEKLKNKYSDVKGVDLIKTNSNGGYSAGNNFGIKYAIKKYGVKTVGIMNPDVVIPDAEVFKVMLNELYMDDSFAIIGGSAIDIDGRYNINGSSWDIPTLKKLILNHSLISNRKMSPRALPMIAPKLARVDCVIGCFFLAKVSHMKAMDFFDENVFLYNEENILGIKCKKLGYKEVLALDQFYYHNHKKRSGNIAFKQKVLATKNSYESRKYLCRTYYSKSALPFLWIIEMVNRIYLAGCYMKSKILK